jgi:hypothetical protein
VSFAGEQGGEDTGYANANGANSFSVDGASATSNYFGNARGERAKGELDKLSKPVTGDMIAQVGSISANNDDSIGHIIADAMQKVPDLSAAASISASSPGVSRVATVLVRKPGFA